MQKIHQDLISHLALCLVTILKAKTLELSRLTAITKHREYNNGTEDRTCCYNIIYCRNKIDFPLICPIRTLDDTK
uniref:Uncharacterized protein n=1 Tax=Papilio xuthus TaxID=66420 RepID=I4DLL5_PAPXU|nr:unknown secreted protein [Papilio xuthus]